VWAQFAQGIHNDFNVPYPSAQSYNGLAAVSATASSEATRLVPSANTVVIGSSMGGLVAREIRRQQGSGSNVAAIITVGTPHVGAPVTVTGKSHFVPLAAVWAEDLAYGWASVLYGWSDAITLGIYYLSPVVNTVYSIIDPFSLNSPAALDMNPGSAFLGVLNANPSATLPVAHYTIYSQEDWNSHWRIADSHVNGIESGDFIQYADDLIAYYSSYAAMAYFDADNYYDWWLDTGDYEFLDMYNYWLSVGEAFHWGAYAVSRVHQQDFNTWIIGEPLTAQQVYERNPVNDALVPRYSQAPSFVAGDRHLQALHTNHEEETYSPEVYEQIKIALRKPGLNLPLR
jgi:triacylglycerol esterase/lipase EstA (alpha/beta hydrolase family)